MSTRRNSSRLEADILVGPTAVGKTAIAHLLAKRRGARIISADSMLVYRGMDIGTAKPTPNELQEYGYSGVNIVNPDQDFNLSLYLEHIRSQLDNYGDEPLIIVGGTGLYVKTLTRGLDDVGTPDHRLRAESERILAVDGLAALQDFVAKRAPERYATLKDKSNPRRLVRALEDDGSAQRSWGKVAPAHIVGLRMKRSLLAERIAGRVDRMYADGLLKEAERLVAGDELSRTARQAIGYKEAMAVLRGKMEWPAARERICTRTRRLAKSQMTWFRNQERVDWVDVENLSEDAIADSVEELWEKNGKSEIRV